MAIHSPSSNPSSETASANFDRFVVRSLDRASAHVKVVDLVSAILLIATVVLGVLLVACLIDGWVFTLGPFLRLTILIGLALFALLILLRTITPLILQRINPAYTARMIEQSDPKFKNSLLNYVFLRTNPQAQGRRVFEAIQSKAARDLSEISIDSAVDRSRLIHIGFALLAIVVACGLYKLISPKDPLATVARVIAPLSDIPAPSRVRIANVKPGSVEIMFGETVNVVAEVHGAGSNIPVILMFSTDDGQQVAVPIALQPGDGLHEYVGALSNSDAGIQQSLSYWIVAGDGRSSTYRVDVRASPMIAVSKMRLKPPAYTELPEIELTGQGDIQAIEGTGVHLEAIANQSIRSATIEFLNLPDIANDTPNGVPPVVGSRPPSDAQLVDRIEMAVADHTAQADFRLAQRGDNQRFTHYRIRFVAADGQRNRHEQLYSVTIKPDMAPELEVIEPKQNKLQVPLNGSLPIRARAMDPDFRVSAIRMTGLRQGKIVVQQDLTLDQKTGLGQVFGTYVFRPESAQLQVGDELIFHLAAIDNRHSPLSDLPHPNVTRSGNYELKIVQPVASDRSSANRDDAAQGASNEGSESDGNSQQNSDPKNSSKSSDSNQGESQQGGGEGAGQSGNNSGQSAQSSDSQNPDSGQGNESESNPGNETQSGSNEGQSSRQGASGNQQSANPSQAQDQQTMPESSEPNPANNSGEQQSGGQGNSAQNPQGQPNQGAAQTDANEPSSAVNPQNNPNNSNNASGQQRGADQSAQANSQSEGQPNEGNEAATESSNGGNPAEPQNAESADKSRPMDQATHDGERFEKLYDRMKKERQSADNRNGNGNSQDNAASGQSRSDSAEQGRQDESTDGEQRADSRDNASGNRDAQPSDAQQGNQQSGEQQRPENAANNADQSDANPSQGNSQDTSSATEPSSAQQSDQGNPSSENSAENSGQSGKPSESQKARSGADEQDPSAQNSDSQEPMDQPQAGDDSSGQERGAQPSGDPQDGSQAGAESGNVSDRGGIAQPSSEERADQESQRGSNRPSAAMNQTPTGLDDERRLDARFESSDDREQLEQTKKVTDLVLDYLSDHEHNPDPQLLNEMNWTEQELRDFIQRWSHLKDAASSSDERAALRYTDALRGLGLRNQSERTVTPRVNRDAIRDLNEDGSISRIPEKYAEAFRDFSKGRAKSEAQK